MLTHRIRTPLGVCEVTLERSGMGLDERGGFSARWAESEGDVLELETYRSIVKAELAEAYREKHGREPGTITLNLASHQLIDDIIGWSKLNWRPDK